MLLQDAAFALVEGPPAQEGDVDWEEAVAAEKADGGDDDGGDPDDEEDDGGLTAYAAGAATTDQVLITACSFGWNITVHQICCKQGNITYTATLTPCAWPTAGQ